MGDNEQVKITYLGNRLPSLRLPLSTIIALIQRVMSCKPFWHIICNISFVKVYWEAR